MTATLSDIIQIMDSIAPIRLAEKWDNSGLQIGDARWPVKSIMVALDPAPGVVETACRKKKDLLITHHPLIFKPLSKIDLSSPMGGIISKAIQNRLALYSAHTNLDSATGGINDIIAERIGLKKLTVLSEPEEIEIFKLVFFVPADYERNLLDVLFKTEAGVIGNYQCCSFRSRGTGTYKPGASAKPFSGRVGEITHAEEIRIEAVVRKENLDSVITLLKEHHPYETMAYDIYPLSSEIGLQGIGRIGIIAKSTPLGQLADQIRQKLNLKNVRVSGNLELLVEKVAVCSGSGSSLLSDFLSSGAEVFISGDLKYHDARAAEDAGVGLIDIGHFGSEHLVVEVLAEKLNKAISAAELNVSVEACDLEQDPFIVYSS
ncbi:MAG: Nif3-like dinuclear metal center hexameric protein [Desulfobacterales bacterium]